MFAIVQPELGSKVKLDVFIEQKHVDRVYEKLYWELGQRGDVRGFRRGKVPQALIRRHYGAARVDGTAYAELLEQALRCVCAYGDIYPTRPVDWDEEEEGEGTAKDTAQGKTPGQRLAAQGQPLRTDAVVVPVRPDVKLPDLTKAEFEIPETEPTEEQIESELRNLQDTAAQLTNVERKEVQKGDQVEVVIRTRPVGEEGEPNTSDESLIVGENRYNPPLDEHIIGRNVGETVEFEIDYPDARSHGALAGKKVAVEIDIKDLRERKVPELDDRFAAQAMEGCTTLAELREELRKRLRRGNEQLVETILHLQAAKWLSNNIRIELPEALLEADKKDEDTEEAREMALRELSLSLACEEILRREGVEIGEDEIRQQYLRMGLAQGLDLSQLQNDDIPHEIIQTLRDQIVRRRATEIIVQAATKKVVPLSEFGKDEEVAVVGKTEASEPTEEPEYEPAD
ncbi:MAG: trigger factor [Candidatus Zipacnadales bacterium]